MAFQTTLLPHAAFSLDDCLGKVFPGEGQREMKNSKVVYTSLTLGYDDLKQPDLVRPDYDYICFSNDIPEEKIGIWQIRRIPYSSASGTRLTRYPKLNPHLLLPEYDYSLWVDANLDLKEEIFKRADELIAKNEILAMLPHPNRICVYQEARCLTRRLIDNPGIIYRQVKYLLQAGMPEKFGLFVCCCMLRRHNNEHIKEFSSLWWDFYSHYSYRDQMSVSYALWKTRLVPAHFWTKEFYNTFVHPHRQIIRRALPVRCCRFAYSHLLLSRLYLLYLRAGISWDKCY